MLYFEGVEELKEFIKNRMDERGKPLDSSVYSITGYEFEDKYDGSLAEDNNNLVLINFNKEIVDAAKEESGLIELEDLKATSFSNYTSMHLSKGDLIKGLKEKTLRHYLMDSVAIGDFLVNIGGVLNSGNEKEVVKITDGLGSDKPFPIKVINSSGITSNIREQHIIYWSQTNESFINEQPKQEEKIMTTQSKVKTITATALTANKDAGLEAAKLKVGKTALNVGVKMIKPHFPMGLKGKAEHPIAKVVLANIIKLAVEHTMGDNPKAVAISEAMMTASYFELIDKIDIEAMIDDMLSNFSGTAVDKITAAAKESMVIDE